MPLLTSSHPRAGNNVSIQGIALHWTLLKAEVFLGNLIIILLKNEEDKENKLEEVIKEGCNRRRKDEEEMCGPACSLS